MPLVSESSIYLGSTPIDKIYHGSTVAWESGGSSPLSGAVIAQDFRGLSAWPDGWINPLSGPQYFADTDHSYQADGIHFSDPIFVGPGYKQFTVKDFPIPPGPNVVNYAYVWHYSLLNVGPTTSSSGIHFSMIHDRASAYDAEVGNRLFYFGTNPRLQSFAYQGPPDWIWTTNDNEDLPGAWPVAREFVTISWMHQTDGSISRTYSPGEIVVDQSRPWNGAGNAGYNITSLCDIELTLLQSKATSGPNAFVLKGMYVLPAYPTSEDEVDISNDLLGV